MEHRFADQAQWQGAADPQKQQCRQAERRPYRDSHGEQHKHQQKRPGHVPAEFSACQHLGHEVHG
jgi:hypothetical protein